MRNRNFGESAGFPGCGFTCEVKYASFWVPGNRGVGFSTDKIYESYSNYKGVGFFDTVWSYPRAGFFPGESS